MTAICTTQPIHRRHREPAIVRTAFAAVLNGMRKLARVLKNRRRARVLAGMDDRMLADIGLNRSDLRDAYAQPLWRDPTDTLACRAQEKRIYRRRPRVTEVPPINAPSIAPDAPLVATRAKRSPWHYL